MTAVRSGLGFDLHPLVDGRPLVLGGVTVPSERGLGGHSDADVLTHAVCEALLGSLALGDLGRLFPDTDPRYKGASSLGLLRSGGRCGLILPSGFASDRGCAPLRRHLLYRLRPADRRAPRP